MKLFSIVFSTLIPILLHPLPLQWYYGFLTGELAPPDAYLDEPAPNNRNVSGYKQVFICI